MPANGRPKFRTICTLKANDGSPCQFAVTAYGMRDDLNPNSPDDEAARFFGAILQHLQTQHAEPFAYANGNTQLFFAYLVMSAFKSEDPKIRSTQSAFEDKTLRRLVCPDRVTDGEIEDQLGTLELTIDDPLRELVKVTLTNLRNYYEGKPQISILEPPEIVVLEHETH